MRTFSALRRALAGIALYGILSLPLGSAFSVALTAPDATASSAACTVTSADVLWGFKESFRSYISGTIAGGQWEVESGAGYETPNFTWTGGTGWYDPDAHTGEIAFVGGIHFTGHNGLLDTTVRNPTLVLTGPTTAQVLVDISGVSMEDALAGGAEPQMLSQVPLVDVDTAGTTVDTSNADAVTIAVAAAPTAITAAGFESFGNYETGTAFDPIAFTFTATCPPVQTPTPVVTAEAADSEPTNAVPAAETNALERGVPWIIGGLLAVAVVIAAVGAPLLARRRRRGVGVGAGAGSSEDGAQ